MFMICVFQSVSDAKNELQYDEKKIIFPDCFHLTPSRTETSSMLRKQGGKGMTTSTVWEFQTKSYIVGKKQSSE